MGRATQKKLHSYGIHTIGQLAQADPKLLQMMLGKMGLVLHMFANGEDQTPVAMEDYRTPIKSIGNSTTTPRDLVTDTDVKIIVYALAESVAARLRENHFKCRVVEIWVRDNDLYSFTRQHKTDSPTDLTGEIAGQAMALFRENYR